MHISNNKFPEGIHAKQKPAYWLRNAVWKSRARPDSARANHSASGHNRHPSSRSRIGTSGPVGMGPVLEEPASTVSGTVAVAACAAMAFFYVAILYSPTLLLRLPPPTSLNSFMIRRFFCALISSAVSVLASSALLGIRSSSILSVYGIRGDNLWHAAVFPVLLSSLLYAGSFVSKFLSLACEWRDAGGSSCYGQGISVYCCRRFQDRIPVLVTDILAWRNYVVAPLTEELVFRACMIPLLLCGGFRMYNVIFLCPVFFSLAHLNHFLELYCQKNYSLVRVFMVVGVQLGYTVIFGWYAAFLFIRTGHLISPIVAHIFCNSMGLPAWWSSHSKGIAFLAGSAGFFSLLFPATSPKLYNDKTDDCRCWHGYCSWS